MALSDDLKGEVRKIFGDTWETRKGYKVPETDDIKLGNHAVTLEGTVLYADLAESTTLVETKKPEFAAEVYKCYLHCATKIIRAEKGVITAFDGDRVMSVFIEDNRDAAAVRSALKIRYAVDEIINPALKRQYPSSTYVVNQSVGIDRSDLFVARTGIRGSNDLVWVGRAANYAAKLCALRNGGYSSYITSDVFDQLTDSLKKDSNKKDVWERFYWTERKIHAYKSRHHSSF
jgi:class 3 adenylate cyclase